MPQEPLKPLEIAVRGEDRLVGYACAKCGVLFTLAQDADDGNQKFQYAAAQEHCNRVCSCGAPLEQYYRLQCDKCSHQKVEDREQARFEKAIKLEIKDYDGPVFWGDEYFNSMEDLLDRAECDGLDLPKYVWATIPHQLTLDASDIIHQEIEQQEMHEDAVDWIDGKDVERLQAFLDVWCKEVNLVSYMEDNTRAVLIRPEDVAEAG